MAIATAIPICVPFPSDEWRHFSWEVRSGGWSRALG